MPQKLTVLQVIPTMGAGGAEQSCIDIVEGLVKRQDRALVLSSGGARVQEIENLGGTHITHNVKTKNPAKIIQNAKFLADMIRREKVDLIHARSRAPAWSAWLASQMTGCPYVTTFHAAYNFKCALKRFYNRVMARGVKIIAISDFIAAHIQESYGVSPSRIVTIPRGVDASRFSIAAVDENKKAALRQEWGVTEQDVVILLPARLSPIKGHKLLIHAIHQLPPTLSVKLVIVGDDQGRKAYRADLENLIAHYQLQKSVLMVNHCADMPTAYACASLVVVPSLVPEGFGRVPIEAMAMGVPVIASDLGALRETIIQGRTGWLLPTHDPLPWSQTIAQLLSMDILQRRRIGEAGRARVEALYTRDNLIQKTLALYDDVMKDAK